MADDSHHPPLVLRPRRRHRAAVHDRRRGGRRRGAGDASPGRRRRRPRAPAARRARPGVPQIQPQPGGVRREYWIQAETRRWEIVPTRRDEWHNRRIPGRNTYLAYMYRVMTPGLRGATRAARTSRARRSPARSATCSSSTSATPTASCARRSRCTRTASSTAPSTTAPTWASSRARAASSAPGETFTYQWECTPDSVGAWPYHDHGPNHTLNTFRGLFGALDDPSEGRQAAGPRVHDVRPPAAAAGHAACSATSSA